MRGLTLALFIVVGPPAGGKSTWVDEHANHGDIVIDYDRLAVALSPLDSPAHGHKRPLATVAYQAREAAITEALRHVEKLDLYIIHSMPKPPALARYRKYGAKVITIDPGRAVVEARCRAGRPEESMKILNRWYGSRGRPAPVEQSDKTSGGTSRRW